MNPLILLILAFVLRGNHKPYIRTMPLYFDTFRMELALDRLKALTETLEKVNRLSQIHQVSDAMELLGGYEGIGSLLAAAEPWIQNLLTPAAENGEGK